MITTSDDVAKRAGVSRATVSQILNGRGARFAEATRLRVTQAAAELEYQPSVAARTLARGSSDIVVALIPNTTFGGNLQDIFQSATEELAALGLNLLLHLSTPGTAPLDRVITGMKPRAVISLTPLSDDERALLAHRSVAAFDPSSSASEADPNFQIGALQAVHLVERGYTKLGFAHLRDARQDPFGQGREAGVRAICAENALPEPRSVSLGIDLDEATAALAQFGEPGVGLACYNDDVAMALLAAARLRGWSVPDDLGLIGMDGTPLAGITLPRLTTISYDLGAAAHNLITAALTGLGEVTEGRVHADVRFRLEPGGTT